MPVARPKNDTVAEGPNTQTQLDAATGEREKLIERRAELERAAAESAAEIAGMAPGIAAGDAKTLARLRSVRNEAEDVQLQIEAVDVLLRQVGDRIALLTAARKKEIDVERYAAGDEQVATMLDETAQAIDGFFADIEAALKNFQKVNANLRALREGRRDSPHIGSAVTNRNVFSQLEARRLAALNRLAASFGGIRNINFPEWFIQDRNGIA